MNEIIASIGIAMTIAVVVYAIIVIAKPHKFQKQ